MLSKIRGYITLVQFAITVSITIVLMYTFVKYRHNIRKFWMGLQIKLLGIKIKQIGSLDMSCDMVIVNHQSLLDIVVVDNLHKRDLAWVAKQEITDMFFFGHIIKAPQMISINREDRSGLTTLINESKDRLSKNRPIAIFPEGTRSSGKVISKFKVGAKMLANKYNLKVQPIVLINTREILDSKSMKVVPGEVTVIYLDPIIANKKSSWFEDTEYNMREVLNKYLSNES
jgi:1-acyl-sn-glycerol-3-phosphate acyltransferase